MKGLAQFEPDAYYHIVNHAVGNELLFRKDENYRFFLKRYAQYMPPMWGTLAYCLMPNHIHILIRIHSEKTLEEHPKYKGDYHKLVMQAWSNLLNAYTKSYNKVFERKGALWIDYTKRFPISSDAYLTNVIHYIHQNPVKHGFVPSATDWQHSSYQTMLSENPTRLERSAILDWFGGRKAFIAFHAAQTTQLIEDWEY